MVYPERYSVLIEIFGKTPKVRLFNLFLENPFFDFSKEELVRELKMSKLTVYKYLKELKKLGIVKVSRKIGRATLYKLNLENPIVKRMNEFVKEISLRIAEKELEKLKSTQTLPISG